MQTLSTWRAAAACVSHVRFTPPSRERLDSTASATRQLKGGRSATTELWSGQEWSAHPEPSGSLSDNRANIQDRWIAHGDRPRSRRCPHCQTRFAQGSEPSTVGDLKLSVLGAGVAAPCEELRAPDTALGGPTLSLVRRPERRRFTLQADWGRNVV
eukprot:14249239-Alexandrium_andersonii.AAC.2